MQQNFRREGPEPARESTPSLLGKVFHDTIALLKKKMQLARAEIASDVNAAIGRAIAFAAAGVFALVGVGLLAAAAVLGLAEHMAGWKAALLVGVAMFVIAGIVGAVAQSKKMGKLERTQQTLKEDVRWAKERMA